MHSLNLGTRVMWLKLGRCGPCALVCSQLFLLPFLLHPSFKTFYHNFHQVMSPDRRAYSLTKHLIVLYSYGRSARAASKFAARKTQILGGTTNATWPCYNNPSTINQQPNVTHYVDGMIISCSPHTLLIHILSSPSILCSTSERFKMVVSFVAASRLATESGTEFQKQLDQTEAIPPLELDRTRQDLAGLKGDITVMKGDITGIRMMSILSRGSKRGCSMISRLQRMKSVNCPLLYEDHSPRLIISKSYPTLDLIEKVAALTSSHRLDNARKRLLNAGISALDTRLHILVNVNTGEAIHGFPPRVAAVVEVQASKSGRC